jgi:predicted ATPase/DNA-binding SARP family transcriptional activator
MRFRILGPLEVHHEGHQIALGGPKQRALLGVLLLHANESISSERLVDELWGNQPPARAHKLVQGYVSGLRKLLGPARLVTRSPGYLARVEDGELDALEFDRLVAEARTTQEPPIKAERLREALELWRGSALADLRLEGFAAREAERLNELRLAALLDRIEVDLELGRHAALVGELEALVAAHPLQERFRALLMLALYRSGRQADALELYRATRKLLADELGLDPSSELQRLERLVLTHDPELDPPRSEARIELPPAPTPPPEPERLRRTVSVVFGDLADSTSLGERLDPETLHGVLDRYSEKCAVVLEQHGGTVEKFIGDAVVAVFGLPSLHEDDALRAVRAAVELRQAVAELSAELERAWGVGFGIKLAVNSGEVFVGPGSRREAFASGDAINVAARLQEAAAKGEILLGEQTKRLIEPAVRAEPLEPFAVKGRVALVRAWRLLELRAGDLSQMRPPSTPFVGRKPELAALEGELTWAVAEQGCRLCTIVGAPGVGKSRVVRQLVDKLGDDATVVVGRCLSYGEGITYWPLAEIVRGLGGAPPREAIRKVLGDAEHAELVTERILGAIGLAEPGGREETFWAVRRLLETAARKLPLVAVFEDVHWAEATLLDLLEYMAGFSSGVPILFVCLARPDLLETRPSWAVPQQGRTMLELRPLPEPDAQELVALLGTDRLSEQAQARIVETGEGNPLFLEQLVAVQASGESETLPPSVQAVLAARIDRLEPGERAVLAHASVEGRTFHRGALATILPPSPREELGTHLMALVRKQLIRPCPPDFPGEDGFRFTHSLTRDAAYAALPKRLRAELHEATADWLEARPESQDEVVGYHLEQAYYYREEFGEDPELAARAAARLEVAGRRAVGRCDLPAAVNLLTRAIALLPEGSPAHAALLPELGAALIDAGDFGQADRVLTEARQTAESLGDEQLATHALVHQLVLRLLQATTAASAEAAAMVDRVLPVFARAGDELGLGRARRLEAWVHWIHGDTRAAEAAWEAAAEHARRAGAEREEAAALLWLASAALSGPAPANEGVARCRELLRRMANRRMEKAQLLNPLAGLEAMLGRFAQARELLARAAETLAEYSITVNASSHPQALVAMLADDPAEAERCLRVDYENLASMGEKGYLSTTAALLARAVEAQGRDEEAYELTEVAEQAGAADDFSTQVVWRGVRARLIAKGGATAEAERLAREAVTLAEKTDRLNYHGGALVDLAAVLRSAGQIDGELEALEAALELYERKCNLVAAAKLRPRVDELKQATPLEV